MAPPPLTHAPKPVLTPAQRRTIESVEEALRRTERYDDESAVHEEWVRQRYDGQFAESYIPARREAVRTAWHEAGHAVAALAAGARFSSASIRTGSGSAGRVHAITGGGELAFVIAAAGQVAEGLRDWSLPDGGAATEAFLKGWKADGGDARRFRREARARYAGNEPAAWAYAVDMLTPLRPRIARLARGLLVHPRYLPYPVAAAIADLPAVPRGS